MSQCTAIAKSSSQRCRKHAIAGGTVCRTHGGAAGQVRRAARERLVNAAAAKALRQVQRTYGRDLLADVADRIDNRCL
jgi:hypothetical protein